MLKVQWKGGNIFEMNSMNTWKNKTFKGNIHAIVPSQKNGEYKYNYISYRNDM
jgi:hypothetical protein